ncbi:hypothetical protein [Kitasatospora camelliae]|uniref:Peptidase MA-like domain-containing protein n=1 Tax=Kitasatospora camelliae TaxID=3156397 RepID=A0AAU8JVR0_9ACTN
MSFPPPPTAPGGPSQPAQPPFGAPPGPGAPGAQPFPQQQPPFGAPPFGAAPQPPGQQPPYGAPPFGAAPQPPYAGPFGGPQPPYGAPDPYGPPPERPRRLGLKVLVGVGGTILGLTALVGGLVVYKLASNPGPEPLTPAASPWQTLADGLTSALAAKDEEAFLRRFKGDEVREQQRKVFRNLVKIPWEQASWEASVPDSNHRIQVVFVHQIKGADVKPVGETYSWTVEPGDTAPWITGVGGYQGIDGKVSQSSYYPAPWDVYDNLAVENRDSLVIVADQSQAGEVKRDADTLAQAARDDLAAWRKNAPTTAPGKQAAGGFFVVLEKRREVYNKLYAGEGKVNDSLEAGVNLSVPAYAPTEPGKRETGGSRIVMDTSLSRFTMDDWKLGVTDIGRHEMGHAIVAPLRSSPGYSAGSRGTQSWVAEGFAEYMATRGKDDIAKQEAQATLKGYTFDGRLPEELTFYSKESKDRSAHYVLGGMALRYMGQKYGEAKVFAFVAAHYNEPDKLREQITEATGLSQEQFEKEWSAWVRSSVPGIR